MTLNRTILLSLVLTSGALAPAAALAKHGADDPAGDDRGGRSTVSDSGKAQRAKTVVRVAGECTGDSTAKLKVKRERGRLKTEFEVDQNSRGVVWDVQLRRNGAVAVDTTRTTRASSGSLRIERPLANGAGPDTISATATSPSGEVCTASATI